MNERIKELSAEAWKYAKETVGYNESGYHDAFEQKFAELIVQDINNTILHTARWHQEVEKDDNTVMALCDLVKDIREEYGVEE